MNKEQFLAMIESGPNKERLRREYEESETRRQASIPDVPFFDKSEAQDERALQAQCEGWLSHKGYRRMTAPEASRAASDGSGGWWCHLHRPKENPLMPDFLITDSQMRHCIGIELKVRNHYQPGQKEFIDMGLWTEVRKFECFVLTVLEWEKECKG